MKKTGSIKSWYMDCVYAEAICGVAQIVRDPSIPLESKLSMDDKYIGLPSPFGAFTAADEMETLKR